MIKKIIKLLYLGIISAITLYILILTNIRFYSTSFELLKFGKMLLIDGICAGILIFSLPLFIMLIFNKNSK